MTSIGESLRRERLRRNLQLDQISSELKISSRMLAAIEAEDFGKLPGGVFAKSFVRQYAHLLGLDEEEMAAEVDRILAPESAVETMRPETHTVTLPRMEAWQSVGEKRSLFSGWSSSLPALVLVVVVMLVCSAVYAYWQRPRSSVAARTPAHRETAAVSHVPPAAPASGPQTAERAAAPAPAPAPKSPPSATAATSAPATTATSAPATAAASTPATAATSAPTTGAAPEQSGEATTAPAAAGAVHVEITATEPVWLRVSSDGKSIFSGTLAANESRVVDAGQKVELRLGNAGGVNVSLNGKPIGPIGPKGQVRNVQLTSGGFQIVAPPKSPPIDPL
jgi:cytoskeleton protein RodZ